MDRLIMENWQFTMDLTDGTKAEINPHSCLIFLDETGDEGLSDPNYRIFGLGGCCVLARDYCELIDSPWKKFKHNALGSQESNFHTVDVHLSRNHSTLLYDFFSSNKFGRFAAIASNEAEIDGLLTLEQVISLSFYKQVEKIIRWFDYEDVVVIYEKSERFLPKLDKIAKGIRFSWMDNGSEVEINVRNYTASKKLRISGLEVSDLIIHTAGTALRDKLSGKINSCESRTDFKKIFTEVDSKYSAYINIKKADFTPSVNPS